MRLDQTSDLWWKNAVVYCLDVETFLDSDGDGVGDFAGPDPADRLPGGPRRHLPVADALLPSPNRDDGYDVSDYYGVDPRLGNLGDFVELVRTANDRGIKVIVDLVVNHTSDEHPWFKAARDDRESPFRSYYVWRDEPSEQPAGIAFPGQGDEQLAVGRRTRGQYYLHRFYRFQPDLNMANPAVRDEIAKIVGFWLQLGVRASAWTPCPSCSRLEGDRRSGGGRPARSGCAACARSPLAGAARRAARRGQHRAQGPRALLRRRGRRPAAHAVRVPPQPEPVAGARPRGRGAARGRDPNAAGPCRPTTPGRPSCETTTS